MRDYVIINGVNSLTINGLAISKLPPISKPLMRNRREEIDGRDGDIITELGYSAYDKEMEIGLYGNFDINEIISFFNGEGTITFSNDDDKHYYFKILEQIDYEKLLKFKTATITFHCQPFKYLNNEEIIDVDSLTLNAEGTNIILENTSLYEPIITTLQGDTIQDGTPTPDNPVEIKTVSGRQEINICGKNIFNFNDTYYKRYTNTDVTIENNNITVVNNNTSTNGYVWWNIPVKIGENINISFESIISENDSIANRPYYYFVDEPVLSYNTSFFQEVVDIEQTYIDKELKNKTVISTKKYLFLALRIRNGINGYTINNLQVEYNTQPTSYEEYKEQSYEIWLDNNLFDRTDYTKNKRIDNIGGDYSQNNCFTSKFIKVEPNTTYVKNSPTEDAYHRVAFYTGTTTDTFISKTENNTFTTPATCQYLRFCGYLDELDTAQLLKENEARKIIELCKIGDYQDKIYKQDGKWYLYKEIGKIVLDGSQNWQYQATSYNDMRYYLLNFLYAIQNLGYCTHYSLGEYSNRQADNQQNKFFIGGTNSLQIRSYELNKDNFNSWLSLNKPKVYYVLATPTTEEITDTELVEQLELLGSAFGYNNITNIQSFRNLPAILNVSATAIPKTIINNIGNIYAKPLLTIKGSGDISVYLNGIQLLQISLGDREEITIDISKMEAYDEETKVLLNRLVIGDYSKFLINSGVNELLITGDVSNFIMSNYTRWL